MLQLRGHSGGAEVGHNAWIKCGVWRRCTPECGALMAEQTWDWYSVREGNKKV